jgi:hypothetical protein
MLLTTIFASVSSSLELLTHLDSANHIEVSVQPGEDERSYVEIQESVLFKSTKNFALFRIQTSKDENSPILFSLEFNQEEAKRLQQFWDDYLKLSNRVFYASLSLAAVSISYSFYHRVSYLLFFSAICVFTMSCAREKYLLAFEQRQHFDCKRRDFKSRAFAIKSFRNAVLKKGLVAFNLEKLALDVDDAIMAGRFFTKNEMAFLQANIFLPENPELLFRELKKWNVEYVFHRCINLNFQTN